MSGNIRPTGCHETSVAFDAIEDYTEKAWRVAIDEFIYYFPKSEVRVYHNSMKLYAPNWLLMEKDLI